MFNKFNQSLDGLLNMHSSLEKLLYALYAEFKSDAPKKLSKDLLCGLFYAVSTLDDDEKNILFLRFFDNKSIEEISVLMDISEGLVSHQIKKAFDKLHQPARWSYICHGIHGNLRLKIAHAYRRGYQAGYVDGYRNGINNCSENNVTALKNDDIFTLPIDAMHLSTGSINCLKRVGIENLGDIVNMEESRIRVIRNLGAKRGNEIALAVRNAGIFNTAWDKWLL